MPTSSTLWMAAGLLWVLDACINISMEPFRAFVADMLPEEQRTRGFAMQSVFIGLGAVIASALPWMLTHWFGVTESAGAHAIPFVVRLSFRLGAGAFLGAVLWTIFRTREYPPENLAEFHAEKAASRGLAANAAEMLRSVKLMPQTMRQLAAVQVCTWLGLFCMWLYFPVAVAHNVFGAPDTASPLYTSGIEWAGLCFGMYSVVCFLFSLVLPAIARKLGRRHTHSLCLLAGAAGLMSTAVIHNPKLLLLSMTGVGVAWASILAMPYAILAGCLPTKKTGIYMGIFNFFIVLPEIVASLGFGWVMNHLLDNNRMAAVIAGGVFLMLAALMMQRVRDTVAEKAVHPVVAAA